MSQIIAVAGTSHSPALAMDPEVMWKKRAEDDMANPELYDNAGVIRPYADLEAEAAGKYHDELSPQVWREKYERCQKALVRLGNDLRALVPDLLLVIGDDQDELFTRRNQPAIAVYYGKELATHEPIDYGSEILTDVQRDLGMDGTVYPAHPEAGRHIIRTLVADGFDVAASSETEAGSGFGHAFAFVVGRLLAGYQVPVVPILINTYFPPNQPVPGRCYDLGRGLKRAIDTFPGDLRVAVVASGGLSHFVVDEGLDQLVLDAMRNHDAEAMRHIDPARLNSGTSEARNWIVAAGAGAHLAANWTEYVPAWRSEGGTGIGLAFGLWS
jgi:Catalytic LigB subunit of aromatic ring-opening dioxygenase